MTLEELYDCFGESMYRYLALRLGSVEDAEDVLQETFCRLARYRLKWAFIRNPRAFVHSIARNEANRYLASRIRRGTRDRTFADRSRGAALVIESPGGNDAALIIRAVEELPEEQKEVVILKVFQEFSFREIASICGLSMNTVASRYRYGIAKLRSRLEGKS
jgi:RNA polymerase sigma-70 factor (ECF subfamily)